MAPGAYTYVVTGTAPCADASAVVAVAETTAPDAGQAAAVTVCSTSGAIDLFAELGGTPQTGGTWTDAAGVTVSGFFDPAAGTPGPFTYSIDGGACPTATAVVDVSVESAPDAGDDGSITLCSSGGTFTLIDGLGGTPSAGGIWTDASGLQVPDVFDPAAQAGGQFTYTVNGSSICPLDASTLQIAVVLAPLAGTDGSLTLCASSPTTSLFDGLGGTLDAGGAWTDPSGAPHGTVVDPAVDPAGPYVYTVLGTTPCPNATATVEVMINPEPFAGDDSEATYCSNDPVVELFQVLGGTPQQNGTWTAPSGASFNGLFDPMSGQPGVYVYTVIGPVPCGSDQAQVTVLVTTAPDAGSDGAITLCAQDAPVDLFAQLGGTPQPMGSWTGPDGQQVDATFDPSVDPSGTYVYTVQGVAPCEPVTAEVVVTVVPPPVADIQVLSNGSCAPATVVLAHAYTGPGNCTWILGNGQVVEDCAPVTAVYELPGSYDVTLIVDAGNGCGADTLTLEDLLTVYTQPTAQFDPLPAQINTLDPEVFFHNTSSGAVGYTWSVDGVEVSTEEDLRYMFPAELGNSYVVCLAAIASPNCADSLCRVIEVEDGMGVFVPNSFTPNDDDINETFGPELVGIDPRFYSFMVFDRWGLEVFSTNDPTARWDGRSPDGADLPVDVYVWKLMTKDAYSGARIERLGHVSLLR
jgi:gliding motility-associated-like protein